jgi:hypothetical protein
MYTSMYGCEVYGYESMMSLCTKSHRSGGIAAIYWVSFIFFASMMILNLFIGVIMTSMDEAKLKLMEEKAAEESGDVGSEESTLKARASSRVDEELDGKYVALAQTIKEIEEELSSLKVDEMIRTKLRTFSKAVRPPKRK